MTPAPRRTAPALVLVGILLSWALAGCGGSGSPRTPRAPRAAPGSPRAPLTIFQDQAHVLSDPNGTLDILRSLGVTDVRISVGWSSLAPDPTARVPPPGFRASDPAAYPTAAWAPYDAAVRAVAARGMSVYFLLTGPAPLWASAPAPAGTATHNPGVYEPSARLFAQFVTAVGTRYDGSFMPRGSPGPLPAVRFWSIWDEPNYGYDLAPQAMAGVEVSPYLYRGLLDGAWSALHATGHSADTILIGETAPRGANVPGVANGMVPLRFLRALYCVDAHFRELRGTAAAARRCPTTTAAARRFRAEHPALFAASGFAAHLYTPGQVAAPNLSAPASEPDWAGLADLPRLERTLDRLSALYGSSTGLPIYDTEFGFQTNPPPSTCACVFLSPARAAYYLNWAEYIEWSNPRIRSDAQYLLYDAPGPPTHPNESGFSSGLLFVSGAPKPDYAAFRLPLYLPVTATRRGQSLEVWGDVRPSAYGKHDTGSIPPVDIQFRPLSGGGFQTLRSVTVTGASGAFEVPVRFDSSGSVRLRWTYPSGFAHFPPGTTLAVTSRSQHISIR